ncbi:MAG: S9 family peptidase [Candidatus Delongbacteria bacterium]|nr:S9 family peptidase [Candidatus Delongbacteria bacterium]
MTTHPQTKKLDLIEILHEFEVSDPYRWLEELQLSDPEKVAEPENLRDKDVGEWISIQNSFSRNRLDRIKGRPKLRKRLTELLRKDFVGMPSVKEGTLFYYTKYADEEHYKFNRRGWPDGIEEILLDSNTWTKDGSMALAATSITRDAAIIAYGINVHGSDWEEWKIMDLTTMEQLDIIPRLRYTEINWAHDKAGFYYSRSKGRDPDKLEETNNKVFYHELGTDWRDDEIVFGEQFSDEMENPFCYFETEDGKYTVFGMSSDYSNNHLWIRDNIGGTMKHLTQGLEGDFGLEYKNEDFFVFTNFRNNGYEIGKLDLETMSVEKMDVLIEAEQGQQIEEYSIHGEKMYVLVSENVSSHLFEYDLKGKMQQEINLPCLGDSGVPDGKHKKDALFFQFDSFFYPFTIFRMDYETGGYETYQQTKVPFNPDDFVLEQKWYESDDGTEIPMFIMYKKGTKLDCNNPTILYGYGGFNESLNPSFSATRIPWLEAGGVFAIANIRGGGEFGEDWHKAGMLDKKQNVFDDFIAAGEALIGQRGLSDAKEGEKKMFHYSSSDHLGCWGESNGGLLIGAVVTQRPELWSAAICEVPLIDMVRYDSNDGAKYWTNELGSASNPEQIGFLLDYSPYHNVKKTDYPNMLIETSLGDDRGVSPWHAMKFAAILQENNTGDTQILLKVMSGTGHGHSKPTAMIIKEYVDSYSFMAKYLGLKL